MTAAIAAIAPAGAVALAVVGYLRYRFRLALVWGPSMLPTLADGDRVLVRRTRPARIRHGDVVLVCKGGDWIVKRVAARPGDPAPAGLPGPRVPTGRYALLGDNPQWSIDSRDFGYVAATAIFGVVTGPIRWVR
jgi:signal peptidase I